MSSLLGWFSHTKFWKLFASKYLGYFTFRIMGYPKFPIEKYFEIVDLGEPDQLYGFACSDYESLAARAIKWSIEGVNYFTHAGILKLSTDRDSRIYHMKGEGLRIDNPLRVLKEIDYIAICRVPLKPEAYLEANKRLEELVLNKDQIEYDYAQEVDGNNRYLYCSELFYSVFDGLIDDPDFALQNVLGREAFVPDAVFKSGELIYTNHPEILKTMRAGLKTLPLT